MSSILVGPGLGAGPKTFQWIQKLSKQPPPVVIDADALTVAAQKKFSPFPTNWIATPHAGELSRLLQITASEIEADRLSAARKAQQKWGGIFLLKGFHTVVAFPQVTVIIPFGNAALGKGGSGDVLAGMIAGFLSQGVPLQKAPLLAAALHGWMADQWLRDGKDILSLTPQDLLQMLPQTLKKWRPGKRVSRKS